MEASPTGDFVSLARRSSIAAPGSTVWPEFLAITSIDMVLFALCAAALSAQAMQRSSQCYRQF
jgi:hypothetical protein